MLILASWSTFFKDTFIPAQQTSLIAWIEELWSHYIPLKQHQNHPWGRSFYRISYKFLDQGTWQTHAYLSDSFRSAEVMGWVLNLSEVFLFSPGEKTRTKAALRHYSVILLRDHRNTSFSTRRGFKNLLFENNKILPFVDVKIFYRPRLSRGKGWENIC